MTRVIFAIAITFVTFMPSVVSAQTQTPLEGRFQVDVLAENVAGYIKQRKESKAVLTLEGLSGLKGHGLAGLERILAERLEQHGVSTDTAKSNLAIKGKVKAVKDSPGHYFLSVSVVNDEDEVQLDLGGIGFGGEDIGRMLGLPFDASAAKQIEDRPKLIADSAKKPSGVSADNIARASAKSPYGVEVRVKKKAQTLKDRDGLSFAEIDVDQEYTLLLHNNSDDEAVGEVYVDGLSAFHFAKERNKDDKRLPKYQRFVIAPKTATEVEGWFVAVGSAKGFKVTPAEDSLAAKLGRTSDIGVITVNFHNSWLEGNKPPPTEPEQPKTVSRFKEVTSLEMVNDVAGRQFKMIVSKIVPSVSTRVGTTFGEEKVTDLKGVERNIGVIQASVSIRYEKPKK